MLNVYGILYVLAPTDSSPLMPFPKPHSAAVYATFGVAVALYVLYSRPRRSKLPLPPGPKKRFFFGNLFDVPATFQWKVYKEWSKQLGLLSYQVPALIADWLCSGTQIPISSTSIWQGRRSLSSRRWRRQKRCLINGLCCILIGLFIQLHSPRSDFEDFVFFSFQTAPPYGDGPHGLGLQYRCALLLPPSLTLLIP